MLRDVVDIQLTRVRAHLVLEEPASLIDCGYAGSTARIDRAMRERGRKVTDLARVVVTHGHPDHAGSARELAALGIPILIHPADAANLGVTWRDALQRPSRGRIFAAMTPEPPAVEPIEAGQVSGELLDLLRRKVIVDLPNRYY